MSTEDLVDGLAALTVGDRSNASAPTSPPADDAAERARRYRLFHICQYVRCRFKANRAANIYNEAVLHHYEGSRCKSFSDYMRANEAHLVGNLQALFEADTVDTQENNQATFSRLMLYLNSPTDELRNEFGYEIFCIILLYLCCSKEVIYAYLGELKLNDASEQARVLAPLIERSNGPWPWQQLEDGWHLQQLKRNQQRFNRCKNYFINSKLCNAEDWAKLELLLAALKNEAARRSEEAVRAGETWSFPAVSAERMDAVVEFTTSAVQHAGGEEVFRLSRPVSLNHETGETKDADRNRWWSKEFESIDGPVPMGELKRSTIPHILSTAFGDAITFEEEEGLTDGNIGQVLNLVVEKLKLREVNGSHINAMHKVRELLELSPDLLPCLQTLLNNIKDAPVLTTLPSSVTSQLASEIPPIPPPNNSPHCEHSTDLENMTDEALAIADPLSLVKAGVSEQITETRTSNAASNGADNLGSSVNEDEDWKPAESRRRGAKGIGAKSIPKSSTLPVRGDMPRGPRDFGDRGRFVPGSRAPGRDPDVRIIVDVSDSRRGRGGRVPGRGMQRVENSRWVSEKPVMNPTPRQDFSKPALFHRTLPQQDLPSIVVDELFNYIRVYRGDPSVGNSG